ncbi:MAG: amidohydrolase family protein [Novosphingobium sp.]|nr:amidohydrolase family protein [Novosphingobium sp.]
MSRTLFTGGRVLTCSAAGKAAFDGDILVEDSRIVELRPGRISVSQDCRKFELGGATIMPGLGDAHVHFGQPLDFEFDYMGLVQMTAEDAALSTAAVAARYIENGITTCVSGGIAQARGDVALAENIDRGWIAGPRIVPGGEMITDPEGIPARLNPTTAAEMKDIVAEQCELGVKVIKLFISGENVMPPGAAAIPIEHTFMNDALVEAAVNEADRHGAFVNVHARGAGSVKLAARCGVRLISHASCVDDEALSLLEGRNDVWVCPGLEYLWALLHKAPEPYSTLAKEGHFAEEYEAAVISVKRMAEAGVPVLPGGDYGHVWIPHGAAALDLAHFVERAGMSPAEAVFMGTHHFGGLTGLKVGQLAPGYFADMLVVDGNPADDITLLQDRSRRRAVLKGGEVVWRNSDDLEDL